MTQEKCYHDTLVGEGHTQFQRGLLDFTRTYETAAIFSCQRHLQQLMKTGVEWHISCDNCVLSI